MVAVDDVTQLLLVKEPKLLHQSVPHGLLQF
jgi:hypothetical protein